MDTIVEMKSSAILKKFFGTSSEKHVSLDMINSVVGELTFMKNDKEITKKDYKSYMEYVSSLRNSIKEREDEKSKKLSRENAKQVALDSKVKKFIEKRHEKSKMDTMKEFRAINIHDDFIKGKEYKVSYFAKIAFHKDDNSNKKEQSQLYISEDVVAKKGDTKYDLINRAMEQRLSRDYEDSQHPFNVVWRNYIRIVAVGEGGNINNVSMGRINMFYKSFTDLPDDFNTEHCVHDYLMYESASSGRKRWTHTYLINQLGNNPNTDKVLQFVMREGDISMYALDMTKRVYASHVPDHSHMSLYFMCNNKHLYPITDARMRAVIKVKKAITFDDVKIDYDNIENVEAVVEDDVMMCNAEHIIVKDVKDLTGIAGKLMKANNSAVESTKYYNNKLTGFILDDKIYTAGDKYDDRKFICESEYAKNNLLELKFINQGYGQIARAMFESRHGDIKCSYYSPQYQHILENNPKIPYRSCNDKSVKNAVSIDIRKDYSNILKTMSEPFPVYSPFDCVLEARLECIDDIKCGEYYVAKTFYMGYGNIKVSRDWHPSGSVKYFVNCKYIKLSDITLKYEARSSIPASTFKKFVEDVYLEYPDQAKDIINYLIGCFGSLYYRKESAGVSTDWETTVGTMCLYGDKKMKLNDVGDLYILRVIEENMKSHGDMPIYRAIIAQGVVELDKLTREIVIPTKNVIIKRKNGEYLNAPKYKVIPGTRIIGYNTDAIKIVGRYNSENVSDDCPMGGYHKESPKALTGYTMNELEENQEYVYKPLVKNVSYDRPDCSKSQLILADAGAGKTHLIANTVEQNDIVLFYTNASCERLKQDKIYIERIKTVNASTFDSFMKNPKTDKYDSSKLKDATRVWLDEYKTLPSDAMASLLDAKLKYGFVLICLGDSKQTIAPESAWVEYSENKRFLEAVDCNITYMPYNIITGRYKPCLKAVLDDFVATDRLSLPIGKIQSYYNICLNNKNRHEINKECLARWAYENNKTLVEIKGSKYKDGKGKMRKISICEGLEMMAYDDNDLQRKIFKTERYVIKELKTESIVITREGRELELLIPEFIKIFDYPFAYTPYKIQSITIRHPFNIHQAEKMSHNELYTALSRGTCLADVHIDSKSLIRYTRDVESHINLILKKSVEKIGHIYLIPFKQNDVLISGYVGQTEKMIEERYLEHKLKPTNESMKDAFVKYDSTVELIEKFKYSKKETIDALEKKYIDMYKDMMPLLNAQHNVEVKPEAPAKTVKPKKEKFMIRDDKSKKRYEISYTVDGAKVNKRFPYGSRSMEDVLAEANEWRVNYIATL